MATLVKVRRVDQDPLFDVLLEFVSNPLQVDPRSAACIHHGHRVLQLPCAEEELHLGEKKLALAPVQCGLDLPLAALVCGCVVRCLSSLGRCVRVRLVLTHKQRRLLAAQVRHLHRIAVVLLLVPARPCCLPPPATCLERAVSRRCRLLCLLVLVPCLACGERVPQVVAARPWPRRTWGRVVRVGTSWLCRGCCA